MKIRVTSDPAFTDTVLGVRIVNGVSETDFNQRQIEMLKSIGRFEFEIISEECRFCEERKNEIEELKNRIQELEKKLEKKK